jgi:hypothetical protein
MDESPTKQLSLVALQEAIACCGANQSELARRINAVELPMPHMSPKGSGHVSQWVRRGRAPEDVVLRIEAATGVSRHKLRPDVFGFEPIPAPAPANDGRARCRDISNEVSQLGDCLLCGAAQGEACKGARAQQQEETAE